MIARIITKALPDLLLPGVVKILFVCVVGYMLGWMLLAWGLLSLVHPWLADLGASGMVAKLAGSVAATGIAWLLFPLLYPILVGFFVESLGETIEAHDYPHLQQPKPPFWPSFWQDVKFSLKAIGLNVLCIPLYFIPLVNIAVYYALNGYLLGRQFFCMAAGRRVSYGEAQALLTKHRQTVFLLGAAIMFCATLPIIGLVAPVLGVAIMLHLFHEANGTQNQAVMEP